MRSYLVVLVATALLLPAAARADGDPASDVLYFTDVFTSFSETNKTLISKLMDATDVARAAGTPIKVAVIWNQYDLGAVPQLFNKPKTYAKFLAAELEGILTGPLVIAMPAGFGVYVRGGQDPVPREGARAGRLPREDGGRADPDSDRGREQAARLARASERGFRAPKARAFPPSAKLGKKAKLRFRVSDNSAKARALVRVYGSQFTLYATLQPCRCGR